MKKPKEFEFLVDAFKSLPGVGLKTATRYSFFILNKDQKYQNEFAKRILDGSHNLKKCQLCNDWTLNNLCDICNDTNRTKSLCIVTTWEDMERIEDSKNFQGYYHIISNATTIRKFNFSDIDLVKIKKQIKELGITEIIIATTFSLMGEAISEFLKTSLQSIDDLSIYRLGFGIPQNANIDYIDDETIKASLLNKKKIISK